MTTYRNFEEMADPLAFFKVFTDFDYFEAADWVITTTEGGGGDATEVVSSVLPCGVLVVTLDVADNDSDEFQWAGKSGAVIEQFKFDSTKKIRFAMRFKINDVTESDFIAGLCITDTTLIDGMTDGIYFKKADGDVTLQLVAEVGSVETAVDVAELVDDTFIDVEFYYDGSVMRAWVDGLPAAKLEPAAWTAEPLALSFAVQAGEVTNAKVLSVDYIGAWLER